MRIPRRSRPWASFSPGGVVESQQRCPCEEALTVVVNLHGAKIRMAHQLLPDSEILLVCQPTGRDSFFRVVSKLQQSDLLYTYWGVESMTPGENIWGVDIPDLSPGDQLKVRVMLECPNCGARESLRADEALLASLQEKGGEERTCSACYHHGLWKLLPFQEA